MCNHQDIEFSIFETCKMCWLRLDRCLNVVRTALSTTRWVWRFLPTCVANLCSILFSLCPLRWKIYCEKSLLSPEAWWKCCCIYFLCAWVATYVLLKLWNLFFCGETHGTFLRYILQRKGQAFVESFSQRESLVLLLNVCCWRFQYQVSASVVCFHCGDLFKKVKFLKERCCFCPKWWFRVA